MTKLDKEIQEGLYDPTVLDKFNVVKGDTISDKRDGRHYKIIAIKRKYITIRRANALHDIDSNDEITMSQLLNDFEKVILYQDSKGINHLEREAIKAYDPNIKSILHQAVDKFFDPETHNKYYAIGEDIKGDWAAYTVSGKTKKEVESNFKKEYPAIKLISVKSTINLYDPSGGVHIHTRCWTCGKKFKSSTELFKHIEKEHSVIDKRKAKSKKVKVYDTPKRCEPSICKALEAKGIDCDTVDIAELIDSTLPCDKNLKIVLKEIGKSKGRSHRDYERMTADFYRGQGKLAMASPQERAAAFAQMRADGTLRGYDLSKKTIQELKAEMVKIREQTHKADKWLHKNRRYVALQNEYARRMSLRTYDPKSSKLTHGSWFKAMVKGIIRSSDVKNPGAIVSNIWKRLSPRKQAEIRSREAKGEVFKYNLPLPDDFATKGTGTLRVVKPFRLAEAQVNVSKKDFEKVKRSGVFRPMRRNDGTTAMVARCKSSHPVNIFVDKGGK